MADIDVRIRQRSLIEFLSAEGEMLIRIRERTKNVYGDVTVGAITVSRWTRHCNEVEGQILLAVEKRSGGSLIVVTPRNTLSDLVSSDFHLFRPVKEAYSGNQFQNEEATKTSVCQWLKEQDGAFTT
ncbi:hypothetical protein Trydic_g12410 [Trypoxylus dichotomus]